VQCGRATGCGRSVTGPRIVSHHLFKLRDVLSGICHVVAGEHVADSLGGVGSQMGWGKEYAFIVHGGKLHECAGRNGSLHDFEMGMGTLPFR
jgi:hypothetical protein